MGRVKNLSPGNHWSHGPTPPGPSASDESTVAAGEGDGSSCGGGRAVECCLMVWGSTSGMSAAVSVPELAYER